MWTDKKKKWSLKASKNGDIFIVNCMKNLSDLIYSKT